jgi:nucleoid-associated protein EbfC
MGPGGFDMQQIFAAAQQMQAQIESAQAELADSEVTGTAGGGAVRAVVSGAGELLSLAIEPSVIDPADPAETASTIADLVIAAVRDASRAAAELQQRRLGALAGGVPGLDLGSLGLPGLGAAAAYGDEAYEDDDDDDLEEDEFDDEEDEVDDEGAGDEADTGGKAHGH